MSDPRPRSLDYLTRPGPGADRRAGAVDALEQQLDELVDALTRLHSPLELTAHPMCRECLTPHPCRTVRLVHPGPDTPAPPEEGSQ